MIDYVLQRAPGAEQVLLDGAVGAAIDAIPKIVSDGAERVMNSLHRREPSA